MKNIKLFTLGYFLFFVLFTGVLFAQSSFNISGSFEGLRKQYDVNQAYFKQEFQYKYDLVQEGDQVHGVSIIYSENGDYAEVKIRGIVIGNKFYFEEYEIVDEIKAEYSVWCFKSGELEIAKKQDKIYLKGATKSYQSNYGYACSGGFTELSKFIEKDDCFGACLEENKKISNIGLDVKLYPNPTKEQAQITFEVYEKTKVKIEIYDLSGRLITRTLNKDLNPGTYTELLSLAKESNGLYIVKLSLGDDTISKELVKTTL